ncbi:LacI family DNA-binding transcriptional regulator [Solilutibacter silvestris]|uniref:Transcriptional regulator n=1 Tax=Solilutibacter silvestris TaxID=1645665 RepID=A0A2K1PZK0_9GAMM|nr:LacI family DNA-binding transcriptional regulator [Lysobacter silvestris]PNS08218.1 Transcriptional regulator [Lysobacter silvestris]
MAVTIKDIAVLAKVSVATVSRALNGQDSVTEEARAKVLAAAAELRYQPHHAARSLSSRRTHTVGVVLPDFEGEFFSELIHGIEREARLQGHQLLVSCSHTDPDLQRQVLQAMRGRVDGLLIMSPQVDSGAQLLENLFPGIPTVLINSHLPACAELPTVNVDNHAGARAIVEHLLECGYRRIAFIAGPEDNFEARERLRAYVDALRELSPSLTPWVLPGDFTVTRGHEAGEFLAGLAERPDAVFAANDQMALGCLFALARKGVHVPDDIALAGFDDIPLAACTWPRLTTAGTDIVELGARAVRRLLAADGAHAELVTPKLIVRESTRDTRHNASPPIHSALQQPAT